MGLMGLMGLIRRIQSIQLFTVINGKVLDVLHQVLQHAPRHRFDPVFRLLEDEPLEHFFSQQFACSDSIGN